MTSLERGNDDDGVPESLPKAEKTPINNEITTKSNNPVPILTK